MGMFDSVIAQVFCPRCARSREEEIQFKATVGGYSPRCADYRIGNRIPGFPRIPIYEAQGYLDTECCKKTEEHYAQIRIIRGVIATVVYPQPALEGWVKLPSGKNTERRSKASSLLYERAYQKEMLRAAKVFGRSMGNFSRLGFAMAYSLRFNLDYTGVMEAMADRPKGGENKSYVRDRLTGKWRRRVGAKY